jgi:hypothetical protein
MARVVSISHAEGSTENFAVKKRIIDSGLKERMNV